ncbi:MAG: hypothetical protein K2X03_09100 [Bryobacteraceae bacterium]|nr:hypothetical protein [Bryobacteraceae bacterium]
MPTRVQGTGVHFEKNVGQTAAPVRFAGRAPGVQAFLLDDRLVLRSSRPADPGIAQIAFIGAARTAQWVEGETTGSSHYWKSSSEAKEVARTASVRRQSIYSGIDVLFHGRTGKLEFDFEVRPGADVSLIQLSVEGAPAEVRADGALRLGPFLQHRPVAYQLTSNGVREPVDCRYQLAGNRVRFVIGAYDRHRPLTIDPVVTAAQLVGGAGADEVIYSGPNWTVGNTRSLDWRNFPKPETSGLDVVITGTGAFTPQTFFFGGSGTDRARAVVEQPFSALAIVGETDSPDLPLRGSQFLPNRGRIEQPRYGGGNSDGFIVVFAFSVSYGLNFATYLGGSGADRLNAVAIGPNQSIVVGGETNSSDLPVRNAAQRLNGGGESDGLWATFTANGLMESATYVGGSGRDAVNAVQFNEETIWLGGATSSVELAQGSLSAAGRMEGFLARAAPGSLRATRRWPAVSRINAMQLWRGEPVVAGDGLVSLISADLGTARWEWALGGSGRGEVLSLSASSRGLLAGGWTDSRDLPVQKSVQAFNAGGQDGWVAALTPEGTTSWLTYLGGSGDDRVLSVSGQEPLDAIAGGVTTSTDLVSASASSRLNFQMRDLSGPNDGFTVSLREPLWAELLGTKGADADATPHVRFELATGEITAEILDPTVATLLRQREPVDRLTFPLWTSGVAGFRCLVDSGDTSIRYRFGDAESVVPLQCRPPEFAAGPNGPFTTFSSFIGLALQSGPRDPRTGQIRGILPLPAGLRITTDTPDIVDILGQENPPNLRVRWKQTGEVTFVATAPGLAPVRVTATVRRPRITLSAAPVGKGLQTRVRVQFEAPTPAGVQHLLTVYSNDSRRLQTSFGPQGGLGPVAFNFQQGHQVTDVYLNGLELGDTELIAISPESCDFRFPIRVEPLTLRVSALSPDVTLAAGDTTSISASLRPRGADDTGDFGFRVRAGLSSIEVPVESSAPAVAQLDVSRLVFTNDLTQQTLRITGRQPGTGTVRFASTDGLTVEPEGAIRVQVTPRRVPFQAGVPRVGENLQTGFTLTGTGDVTVTSLDPARLLVSPQRDLPGQARIVLPSTNRTVFVQALAGAGEVTVRLESPGFEPAEVVYQLRPSGLVLPDSIFAPRYAELSIFGAPWMLDPASRAPVMAQAFRAGFAPQLELTSSRDGILDARVSVPAIDGNAVIRATPTALGDVTLTLKAVGFAPARVRVRVEPQRIQINLLPLNVPRDFQIEWRRNLVLPRGVPITITSANPSALRVSNDPSQLGGASAECRENADGTVGAFLQAMAGSGEVNVILSGPDLEPFTMPVTLAEPMVSLPTPGAESLRLLVPGGSVSLGVQFSWAGAVFSNDRPQRRAGAPPAMVRLENSNPRAVSVDPSAAQIGPSIGGQFRVSALAVGSAELVLRSDELRVDPAINRVTVQAGGPSLTMNPVTLGFGLMAQWGVQLEGSNARFPGPAVVTIESRDPTRLLLSAGPDRPASARIEINASGGSSSVPVFLHALADNGFADVAITLDGAPSGTGRVSFVPTRIGFDSRQLRLTTLTPGTTVELRPSFEQVPSQNFISPSLGPASSCPPFAS